MYISMMHKYKYDLYRKECISSEIVDISDENKITKKVKASVIKYIRKHTLCSYKTASEIFRIAENVNVGELKNIKIHIIRNLSPMYSIYFYSYSDLLYVWNIASYDGVFYDENPLIKIRNKLDELSISKGYDKIFPINDIVLSREMSNLIMKFDPSRMDIDDFINFNMKDIEILFKKIFIEKNRYFTFNCRFTKRPTLTTCQLVSDDVYYNNFGVYLSGLDYSKIGFNVFKVNINDIISVSLIDKGDAK